MTSEVNARNRESAATILVVDDERPVCRLAELILQREGYQVYTAESAHEALAIVEHVNCEVNLLLTDMRMPRVDGHELILRIRRKCPQIATMVFSGYAPDDERPRDYPILPKPFTKQQLLAAVKQILDAQV